MKKSSHTLVIDGFVKSPYAGSSQPKSYKITEGANLINPKASLKNAAQSVHKKAQRSQTLMRNAVRKPEQYKAASSTAIKKLRPKARSNNPDQARIQRSKVITKSPQVQRFNNSSAQAKQPSKNNASVSEIIKDKPSSAAASTQTKAIAQPMPSLVTSVSHQQLERLLDHALTRADAHKKSAHNQSLWQKAKNTPRVLSVGASLLVVFLLAGFFAWQNVPQVAMKVAATRAHVGHASVPAYKPAGFSFSGPVSYNDGAVSMKFKAADNSSRTYTVTEQNSNMTSKSLADTAIPQNTQVQTSQIGGTTVYIYGSNNDAVWVNNGIQYSIKDNANLNSDQILKIASSL